MALFKKMTRKIEADLMAKKIQNSNNAYQAIIMGGGLIGLNISLMVFVYLYWLNTDFHSYMTGHPL